MMRQVQKNKTIEMFEALADNISLELFLNNASKQTIDPHRGKKLTKKQYYTRLSKLVKSGLLVRFGSHYHRTATGELMFRAVDLMQRAVDNALVLKAYDALKRENLIGDLASQLITDQEIVDILDGKRAPVGLE